MCSVGSQFPESARNQTGDSTMNIRLNRRDFVKTGLLCGASAALNNLSEGLLAQTTQTADSFCVALCNHWSYTGIGWQLGIESCVLSAIDAMGMADLAP